MKSKGLGIVLGISVSITCSCQVPSIKETPAIQHQVNVQANVQVDSTKSSKAAGTWHEVLQNQSTGPLEAVLVFFRCSAGGASITIRDSLTYYGSYQSIVPLGSLVVPAEDPAKCSGGVEGAIFADGHVEGKPEAIKKLYGERQGTYQALNEAITLVTEVAEGQRSTQDAIETLDTNLAKSRSTRSASAVGYSTVCIIVRNVLKSGGGTFHIPSDDTERRVPRVEEIMSTRNYTRERARAVVLSMKLKEWQSALSDRVEPRSAQ